MNEAKRLRANLQGEVDSAALYAALAASEPDPIRAGVFKRLAAVEDAHAAFWRKKLSDRGEAAVSGRASVRARGLIWLARRFGAGAVLPTIAAAETRDQGVYDAQADARAAGMADEEHAHARTIEALRLGEARTGRDIARLEGRHRGGANALRAAVLGANDGLTSNLCLVMGMAGASGEGRAVVLAGLAGLIAGACSMAMGEWLSVTNARELAKSQLAGEKAELEADPESEREELMLIYQSKGIPEAQARALSDAMMARPKATLDALAREELGIDPDELGGSAEAAAATSFGLFALGAALPLAPFLLASHAAALGASIVVSAIALAALGAVTSLFTGRGMVYSALRQLLFGAGAALVTYAMGRLFGAVIG